MNEEKQDKFYKNLTVSVPASIYLKLEKSAELAGKSRGTFVVDVLKEKFN